jgi:hypothetical protein
MSKEKTQTNPPTQIQVNLPTQFGKVEFIGSPQAVQEVLAGLGIGRTRKQRGAKTVKILIMELIVNGWFNYERTLSEIRNELSKKGYNIATSSLFPIMLRDFIRKGFIERVGARKNYLYFANQDKMETVKQLLNEIEATALFNK